MATLRNFRFFPCYFARLQASLFKQTYLAFVGRRGNVIFAVNPASVEFEGKESEEGVFLDHSTPVKEKSGSAHLTVCSCQPQVNGSHFIIKFLKGFS